jgi:hypothetical protein
MIGKVFGIVLGVVVIGVVVVGFLAVVPTPATCTPDVAASGGSVASDARSRWDAWTATSAPASVTFTEADATAILRDQNPDTAIKDPVVHFCSDGTAQVSFSYPLGPITIKGVATGTIGSMSPLSVTVTSIAIGGLPSAVTDPVVGSIRDIASQASSLGLAGPVKDVTVSRGQVTISQ